MFVAKFAQIVHRFCSMAETPNRGACAAKVVQTTVVGETSAASSAARATEPTKFFKIHDEDDETHRARDGEF